MEYNKEKERKNEEPKKSTGCDGGQSNNEQDKKALKVMKS
jgi:hypothetical protein